MVKSAPATLSRSPAPEPVEGPSEIELVRLRDGSSVTIRAVSPGDEPALRSFLQGLCLEARRMRFFSAAASIPLAAHLAAAADAKRHGLIAHDETGVVVGHALFAQLDGAPERAEVAVEVADHLHGRGLGTILVERLAEIAEQRGITHLVAEVLCENHAMLDVFRDGFDARVVHHAGPQERVEFLTSGRRLARERFAAEA